VIELFATLRLAQTDDGEPRDVDIVNKRVILEKDKEEEDEYKYIPTKQYAYSQEHKLATIDYF
jgi:hypothetical protein